MDDDNINAINITYESLFDLFRNEKTREELQKLDKNFFKNVINYLQDKKAILDKPDDNMFVKAEKEKTEKQLQSIKRLIKDLYERREKKIISMALIKSRVDAHADASLLLEEEKLIFDRLVKLFNAFRDGVLNNILDGKSPDVELINRNSDVLYDAAVTRNSPQAASIFTNAVAADAARINNNATITAFACAGAVANVTTNVTTNTAAGAEHSHKIGVSAEAGANVGADAKINAGSAVDVKTGVEPGVEDNAAAEQQAPGVMVRFIQYVPSFVGTDLNVYGPFEPEDMACLAPEIVKVLVDKNAAERICVK